MMKISRYPAILLMVGLAASAAPIFAHHSVSAGHDTSRLVTLQGSISRVDWTNPHVWLDLKVTESTGKISTQRVQIAGPGRLTKTGIDRSAFKLGETISVEAWPPIDV